MEGVRCSSSSSILGILSCRGRSSGSSGVSFGLVVEEAAVVLGKIGDGGANGGGSVGGGFKF